MYVKFTAHKKDSESGIFCVGFPKVYTILKIIYSQSKNYFCTKMAKILSLVVVFALFSCVKLTLQQQEREINNHNCHYWSHYNNITNTCDCGSNLYNIVNCKTVEGADTEVNVSVYSGYCFTLKKNSEEAIVGACPYNDVTCPDHYCSYVSGSKQLSNISCREYNRINQLCGQCKDGHSPPVYSYYVDCVRCSPGTNNWPKYLAVSLLPTTAFFMLILLLRFKATSPKYTGYLLLCQIATSPAVLRFIIRSYHHNRHYIKTWGDISFSMISIWNLDFFRLFYKPFCLHSNATTLQVLSLDYIIAVYPLVLIIITYILVKLHYYNCGLVVKLWKPFLYLFVHCRRQWDIQNSLVDAFTTFLLLSYVKFYSVSFDLLTPSIMWNSRAEITGVVLYSDGTIDFFGRDHIPYAILAMTVLLVFTLFPIVLFCLYPCQWFQRFLNKFHCNTQTLWYFMDCFQGCYKDGTEGTRECRWFSALYLMMRLAMHMAFIVTKNTFSTFFETLLLLGMIILLAFFQPYKTPLYNKIDVVFLAILCIIVNSAGEFHGKSHHELSSIVDNLYIFILPIPFIYLFCLIIHYLLRRLGPRAMTILRVFKSRNNIGGEHNENTLLTTKA